ncbi:hypothetical protein JCM6882_002403 [Rhodosporidiobolus microsporus]
MPFVLPAQQAPQADAPKPLKGGLKTSSASGFVEVSAPFQRTLPSVSFPHLASSASFPGLYRLSSPVHSVEEAVAALSRWAETGDLKATLKAHGGALLLRGLPLSDPHAFSKIASASRVGTQPHEEVGRPPKRTVLAPAVSTANEGPAWAPIWTHNEYGWSLVHPSYILFFGFIPAENGGETPINSGIELADELKRRAPHFFRNLQDKGILYSYRYTTETVDTSNSGSSVISAYGKDVLPSDSPNVVREKVEAEVKRHSTRFNWHEDGSLTVWHRVPIIRTHHATGRDVFFGNLISAYARAKHHHALTAPYLGDDGGYHPIPYYGDGTLIDVADLETANQIVEETKAEVNWEQGDVLILDNHTALHSRVPWEGERKILASLWDGEKFEDAQNPWGEKQWEAHESGRVAEK